MFLQLIDSEEERDQVRVDSVVSESCDMVTATSNLSDEVSDDITAERRRELWRRAHEQLKSREVWTTAKMIVF